MARINVADILFFWLIACPDCGDKECNVTIAGLSLIVPTETKTIS